MTEYNLMANPAWENGINISTGCLNGKPFHDRLMRDSDLRYMQLSITPELGGNLPGAELMDWFPHIEFLAHINLVEDHLRCLVRVQFTEASVLEHTYSTFEIVEVVEQSATSALLEVLLTGPIPRVFGVLKHVWWVAPTYLDADGFVLTIRGTRSSLRTVRNGIADLLGDGFKLKLGAQSLHNSQFLELLPDKQRLVLDKAIELGYYDRPRRCTQRTIADALNIKQATVSEHLQSAESTIIHAFVNEP